MVYLSVMCDQLPPPLPDKGGDFTSLPLPDQKKFSDAGNITVTFFRSFVADSGVQKSLK